MVGFTLSPADFWGVVQGHGPLWDVACAIPCSEVSLGPTSPLLKLLCQLLLRLVKDTVWGGGIEAHQPTASC